ncbi:biotin synthase BioB [Leptospira bouyouniensis]|uniref:Biotin synthase n=1 Tax=Leptospira bouyouniensis TaxID=2484911 RepID=A0ABY2L3P4_9LEPT|nr:biotin synthase BioB [Leptospira bouyouniensis]TGK46743.1 biotin synthase BioB [Leptospira bouyouniensis]
MIASIQEKTISSSPSLISEEEALQILKGEVPLLPVVAKASEERYRHFGNRVRIHILDNIKNGYCPEDCGYCAQRKGGESGIQEYSLKSPEEIWEDAKKAKENGAYRFCMVTSGRGPTDKAVDKLAETISKINGELGMKVCLSAGILDSKKAKTLKDAGLDRYNHNLNTSESKYNEICSTHTFKDRLTTLEAAKEAEIGLCSGIIVGMGEELKDIVQVAFELKRLGVISIPVNFFIPIKGHAIQKSPLTPDFCIRVLSMFRLVNPDSEIRVGAGREGHLGSLQSMALYVSNSLFAEGYLNVKGSEMEQTMNLIRDCNMVPEFTEGIPEGWEDYESKFLYDEKNFPELYKHKK